MKHCKKLFALLAAALLCMALTLPAGAAAPLVRDECGVFDADTLADLEEQAESASDGHDVDVYFLVVDDIGDADQRDYAKNYYISNGLGYGDEQSGILFLLAVGSRKYVTITYGEGVTAFTDYRIEQQEDEIVPELSDEEWADAAYTYIDMCDDALDYYADYGEPIDVDNDIGLEDLLIAMIFPLGISAFICLILYHRMKTARQKTEADEYMPGFTLRVKRDRYTHTTRERTYDPPQKESNSSGGSSVDSDGFGGSSGGSFCSIKTKTPRCMTQRGVLLLQSQPRLTPIRRATVSSSQPSGMLRVLPAMSSRRLATTRLLTMATVTP